MATPHVHPMGNPFLIIPGLSIVPQFLETGWLLALLSSDYDCV
jgi:hypothetical protein